MHRKAKKLNFVPVNKHNLKVVNIEKLRDRAWGRGSRLIGSCIRMSSILFVFVFLGGAGGGGGGGEEPTKITSGERTYTPPQRVVCYVRAQPQ